jgi:effector-binding domain-containing protein
MTSNYASLLATFPDMFPMSLPFNQEYEGVELSAYRILNLIESRGYSAQFMNELNNQIKQKDEDQFKEIYTFIFTSIRQKYLS